MSKPTPSPVRMFLMLAVRSIALMAGAMLIIVGSAFSLLGTLQSRPRRRARSAAAARFSTFQYPEE